MPKLVISDFRGGRNSLNAVNEIADNQCPDGQNVWTEVNALRKRRGFSVQSISVPNWTNTNLVAQQLLPTKLAASSRLRLVIIARGFATPRGILYTDDGSTFDLVGYTTGTVTVSGTSVTGSGTAWLANAKAADFFRVDGDTVGRVSTVNSDTSITLAASYTTYGSASNYTIVPAMSNVNPTAWATFDVSSVQNLFMCDDGRAIRYTGTNCLNVANMPLGKVILPFKNYLFVMGHSSTDIAWSALKDATTWPAANTQAVTDTASPIVGGKVWGNSIVILCRNRMFRLFGDVFDPSNPTYVIQEIAVPATFNFAYPRTIVEHQGLLKFLTSDGWYAYDGGPKIYKISQIIQTDADNLRNVVFSGTGAISDSMCAYSYKDRMYVGVCDSTITPTTLLNTIYILDERGAWWQWPINNSLGGITDLAAVQYGASSNAVILAAGLLNISTNGLITFDTTNNDNASAINGQWTSKEFVFDRECDFIEAYVTMLKQSAGNLVFSFSIDRASFVTFNCDMTAGVGSVIRKKIPIARMGKSIRLRVANNVASQTFEVYKIELEYNFSEAERI